MSAVFCQELQPFLESETMILNLKLASLTPHISESIGLGRELGSMLDGASTEELREKSTYPYVVGDSDKSSNPDLGGWSFLQALSNTSQSPKQSSYVPPPSSSKLSEKSLELCTENLGSESSIFSLSSSDLESRKSPTREETKSRQQMESRKVNSPNFPPPLTTMRGMNFLQVRPHREDGRLIIKAIEAPSKHTCLQAERSHGRLRLCFLKDYSTNFDSQVAAKENEEGDEKDEFENEANDEEEEEELEVEDDEEESDVYGSKDMGDEKDEFENEANDEEEEEELEDDEEESDVYGSMDMDGNRFDVGVKMGMEKFQRPSRCKEGGHGNEGLCNWEPFWVATS